MPPDAGAAHPYVLWVVGPLLHAMYAYARVVIYMQQTVVAWSGVLPFQVPGDISRTRRPESLVPLPKASGSVLPAVRVSTTSVST